MEERHSLSLIYGFWVGFKPTSLYRPAHQSQNSLHESSVGCLFYFPELNSKVAFPSSPSFFLPLAYQQIETAQAHMGGKKGKREGRTERRKDRMFYHQGNCRRETLWAKGEESRYKHIVFHLFPPLPPKIVLTLNRKQTMCSAFPCLNC